MIVDGVDAWFELEVSSHQLSGLFVRRRSRDHRLPPVHGHAEVGDGEPIAQFVHSAKKVCPNLLARGRGEVEPDRQGVRGAVPRARGREGPLHLPGLLRPLELQLAEPLDIGGGRRDRRVGNHRAPEDVDPGHPHHFIEGWGLHAQRQ